MALPLIIWILILAATLIALVKGADWFTKGAESVGLKLGIPQFVIGVSIVSIGTSLPEFASSIAAVLQGSSEIVMADVVGSNVTNILLGFGLAAVLCKGFAMKRPKEDLIILLVATVFVVLASLTGVFGLVAAIVALVLFTIYMTYLLTKKKNEKQQGKKWRHTGTYLAGGFVLVVVGAHYLIIAINQISTAIGISNAVIAGSIVALGTSAPEIIVSTIAAMKKRGGIAIGNIIGSNTFNMLCITGVSGLFGRLKVEPIILYFAFPVLVIGTLVLFFVARDKHVDWKEGIVLLCLYVLYLCGLFLL